jgi:LemA protein
VFVYGIVSKIKGELFLHEDERCPLIISKKNRDQYVEEFYKGGNIVYLAHFLVTAGYTVTLLSINYFLYLNPITLLTFLLIGNGIITESVIFSLYNRIVGLKHRALNSLSNIDIELKRRTDLIPNLVEVVKTYSKYEKEIQKIIAESRAKVVFSKEMPKEVKPVIPSLIAVIENYPALKASEQFQYLMRALIDTEERIAYSREFYNRSIRKYNTLIQQFPFLFVSSFLKIKQMGFISISRGETEAPKVSLDKK